jgi:hypothetical protein
VSTVRRLEILKTSRNDETPVQPHKSSYTSDVNKKVIRLPLLCNKGSLSAQTETADLNEQSTMLMVEPHMDLVTKLYDEAVNL